MTDEQTPAAEAAAPPDGWEWAIVEIFGHRSHAGRIREEERFGAKMMRIDVPKDGDPAANGWVTHLYGGASIFSLRLSDETTVLSLNRPYASPYRLTARGDVQLDDEPVNIGAFGDDESEAP